MKKEPTIDDKIPLIFLFLILGAVLYLMANPSDSATTSEPTVCFQEPSTAQVTEYEDTRQDCIDRYSDFTKEQETGVADPWEQGSSTAQESGHNLGTGKGDL